mmetsp:Transcript_57639/g.80005  ORF Transcript_57639/g.80005 Transcript_57639/m.80005 type:complete len:207 (+) Transcript_57639:317-937(+)
MRPTEDGRIMVGHQRDRRTISSCFFLDREAGAKGVRRGFLCYPGIHTCSTTPLCSEHLQDESARITLEEWNVGFWCSLQKPEELESCQGTSRSVSTEASKGQLEECFAQALAPIHASPLSFVHELLADLATCHLVFQDLGELCTLGTTRCRAHAEDCPEVHAKPLFQRVNLLTGKVNLKGMPEEVECEHILHFAGNHFGKREDQVR